MGAPAVVVLDIRPERPIELSSTKDEGPVEAPGPDRLDHALGMGIRIRCSEGRSDHPHPLRAEHRVEAAREATIAPGRTSLLHWARRGVLLLNAALTVPEGMAGGHAKIGWQPVTDAILRAVASQPGPVVFMPWGAHARVAVRRAGIKDGRPHLLCPSVHPIERRGAFIGSNPFGCANDRLLALGLNPIDWALD